MHSPAAPSAADGAAPVGLPALSRGPVLPVLLGAGLAGVALAAKGGLRIGPTTTVEILVTLVGSGLAVAALVAAPTPTRAWGGVTLALLAALAAWTALSVIWSIVPSDSWVDANRMVSYVAAFAGAIALARLAPGRGGAILIAILIGSLVVCVCALAVKGFPGALNSKDDLARLRQPLDYWNSLGLLAAMAVPPCLWLGARRDGSSATRALALPALGIALVTVTFSFSRGALVALAIGLAFWFAVVPLRLRGLAVLLTAAAGTAALSAWTFSRDALAKDHQPLTDRISAGHDLALLFGLLLALLLAAGVLINRLRDAHEPSAMLRRRVAIAALVVVALIPIAAAAALATSQRGFTGTISHGWNEFFADNARGPSYGPDRLTSVGSKRGAYYHEAWKVYTENKVVGAGAATFDTSRLRFRKDSVDVRHAHGYIPQTAADLGLVGLGVSLLLLSAWIASSARAVGVRLHLKRAGRLFKVTADSAPARAGPLGGEHIALLTLIGVVVIFGVHSMIDWTWAVPGTAIAALVAAGYVAGSGVPGAPGAARSARVPGRLFAGIAVAVVGLTAIWAIWQPQRSADAVDASTISLSLGHVGDARVQAAAAQRRDPLSAEPLFQLAAVQAKAKKPATGLVFLKRAVKLQPLNPDTWAELAAYELTTLHDPSAAYSALRAAVFLDPRSPSLQQQFTTAYQQLPRRPGRLPGTKAKAKQPGKAKSGGSAKTAPGLKVSKPVPGKQCLNKKGRPKKLDPKKKNQKCYYRTS